MRSLYTVIESMVSLMPETESSTIASLRAIQNSLEYAAPELQTMWWNRTAEVLNDAYPNPSQEWQESIGKVFAGTQ